MADIEIVNLHAKPIWVYPKKHGKPVVFAPRGPIQTRMRTEDVTRNGIIKRGYWTHTRDLPEPKPGTLYIVGSLVAMFELTHNNRLDMLFPWGMIRAENGNVLACRALCNPTHPPHQG